MADCAFGIITLHAFLVFLFSPCIMNNLNGHP
jgi:hypothetical protein